MNKLTFLKIALLIGVAAAFGSAMAEENSGNNSSQTNTLYIIVR